MASPARLRVPRRKAAQQGGASGDGVEDASDCSSRDAPAGEACTPNSASAGDASSSATIKKGPAPTEVKTTRTRTVKSRAIFTPEDDSEKKPRGRGGKPGRRGYRNRKSGLKELLGDEEPQQPGKASGDGAGDALRKRSRNESDGENRWDRIRAKVKVSLLKMRKDTHFLQVYEQDGWKSSGREKLKPTAELLKAAERVRRVKTELRELTKGLTGMNSGGPRWGALQEDPEGLIEVAEIVCTKCGRGDSDDKDDILLCDYAGCFRAYHQNCLFPPIKPEAFPGEDEDWFCWQCECLADCMEILEAEFQGSKFASWEDVFPDVEATGAEGQGVLLADSDDSDDESFKGSSIESDEEGKGEGEPGENDGGGQGKKKGEDTSEDDETRWMSDAVSVGSDEVAKLHSEAGDMSEPDKDGDVGFGGGSSGATGTRGSRALERRVKRNAALGISDDGMAEAQREKLAIAAALAGNGKIDLANIFDRRTRGKRSVDYVKLNETVFGDKSVDGDQLSSDAEDHVSSEASASESDGSFSSLKARRQSAGRKIPFMDPGTGQKRKRGRPRKVLTGSPNAARVGKPSIDPATGEKRKRGRPRKIKDDVENHDGVVAVKRKRGRPRKVECHDGADAGSTVDKGKGGSVDSGTTNKRKRGRPKKIVAVSENGSESCTKKRKPGRPLKSGSVPKASHASPEKGDASGTRRGPGRPPKQAGERQDADGAASDTASAAAPAFAAESSASPSSPVAGIKRGRGRPRKNAPASPAAAVDNNGDDQAAVGDKKGDDPAAVVDKKGDDPAAVVDDKGDDPSPAGDDVESPA